MNLEEAFGVYLIVRPSLDLGSRIEDRSWADLCCLLKYKAFDSLRAAVS